MLREHPLTLKRGSTAGGSATLEVLPLLTLGFQGETWIVSAIIPRREWWYEVHLFGGPCVELNESQLDQDCPRWRELVIEVRI